MSRLPLQALSRLATAVENGSPVPDDLPEGRGLIVGVTGPPGVGKSSLTAAITRELRSRNKTVAILAVDPSSRMTGGAILGDRVRMQEHHADSGVFIRSMASRGAHGGLAKASHNMAKLFRGAGFDFIILETVGVGQDEIDIASHADVTLVVLAPGMGDEVQAIKAGIMEIADLFVINKADRPGAGQTQNEIHGMLEHAAIFQTVAIDGTGVSQLVDAFVSRPHKSTGPVASFTIDHIGIAVASLAATLPFYETDLGMGQSRQETVETEQVQVAMLQAGESRLELLEATDPASPIAKFIDKRGPGLHHIAMRVPNLTAAVARLKAAGHRILNEPRKGAGGHLYVFVHPSGTGGVLWELIQS